MIVGVEEVKRVLCSTYYRHWSKSRDIQFTAVFITYVHKASPLNPRFEISFRKSGLVSLDFLGNVEEPPCSSIARHHGLEHGLSVQSCYRHSIGWKLTTRRNFVD